jgi:predicted DNA-binding protein (UPF0251 family)
MGRPKKKRFVSDEPGTFLLIPGDSDDSSDPIELGHDEYEALRLVDYEGLFQDAAGELLGVSRQTVGRILQSARAKLAAAFVDGRPIRIEGGEIEKMIHYICNDCGNEWLSFEGSSPAKHCPGCGGKNLSTIGQTGGGGQCRRGRRRKWAEGGRGMGGRRGGRSGGNRGNGSRNNS